jgi:hypothetical protein
MGVLRNVAINNKRFKKCLYFSVDDELLPNGLMQIECKFHQGFTVVGLKFNDLKQVGTKESKGIVTPIYTGMVRDSYILTGQDKNSTWRGSNVPGWVAVNGTVEYEEIDIPNYPYLFKLRKLEMPMAVTDQIVANYKRRKGSHGDIASEGNFKDKYVEQINGFAKE